MGRFLVHICCAPDALYFLERFRQDNPGSELIGFFYDPNIHPYEEYKLRLIETQRTCNRLGIKLIEGEYNVEGWLGAVKGLEHEPERGERCSVCFDLRLQRSAQLAKELGCEGFTTTLLMSPKKKFQQLKESGEKTASQYGVRFIAPDYRKGGGTQEMFRLTKENELYQQDYCGCIYGLFKQKEGEIFWDLVSFSGRRPGSKEESLFIKTLRVKVEELKLPVKEFEIPFLGWKLLEGGVWVNNKAIPSIVVPYSQPIRGKVRADVERVVGDTLYLNKQFVRIILTDSLKDCPLEEIPAHTSPTFRVPKEYKGLLLENRIEVRLNAEFVPEKTRVLLIGKEEAENLIGVPADTLQDGRGYKEEEVSKLIEKSAKDIAEGKTSIILLGAHSLGRVGQRYFEEITGRKIDRVLDYP
ncbi:hypothetical protein BCF55_1283 [Hydrogenivirga caldilitoris]|uniref:Epoxyqueuosine reductase QueH n=1 Tax=Hydrogenivirga caldilitoris TaxID=246264 RepID=A0A497XRT9_9AQUI|nr:epoxyqueuosine reductase QueH [Hydrogenivirga caldilitoris]RLJ70994.1 hypothetical protein BCF55_1283 [Hydrogenivirga caldilitoris]